MKTRELVVAMLVFVVGGLASPVNAAQYKIRWFLGHQNLDYFEEAAADFKKVVEAGSHGDIEVQIVTLVRDGELGTPEIAAKVAKGEVEMGHSFTDVMGVLDPRLYAFEAPYLFRDYRHMEGVFEGPLGAQMLDGLRSQHLVGLSFTYSGGANGVATVDREVRLPADLKGLKVGVYGDAVNKAWLSSLGAIPVTIEHALPSVHERVKDGSLDAVVITWRNFVRTDLKKDFKYFNLQNSTYLVSMTYINDKFFDSLPAKYRALIVKASREAGRIERAKTIELNETSKREMLAKGVRPVYQSSSSRVKFAEALRPAYEKTIEGIIGKDFIEKIKKTADGPEHPSMLPTDIAVR